MTPLRIQVPGSPDEILLWSHAILIWVLVNYVHRLDPLGRAEARSLEDSALHRWYGMLVGRAAAGSRSAPTDPEERAWSDAGSG